jgi:hypothetical protein
MNSVRAVSLATLVCLAGSAAAAQGLPPGVGAPAPGGPPPMAPTAQPPQQSQQQPQQQQKPPCFDEFMPLRQEAEKRALFLRSAMEKKQKLTQQEACAAFKALTAAEGKMVKFVEEKNVWCGIPLEAVKVIKANSVRTAKMRDQVCNGARAGGAPPPPSLSDALGTPRIPDATSTSTGRGTLDSLTGNPLAR